LRSRKGSTRADTLARTIAADILAERRTVTFPGCFTCARTYSKGALAAHGSRETRFCSTLCRDGFDAGLPPYGERSPAYRLPQSGDGFRIECKGCRKPFVSRGLRCCSPECERGYGEQLDIKATMAEVGMEPMREKRKCEHCGGDIPLWRKGKAVAKNVRFCGEPCRRQARRQKAASLLRKPAWP
jgi:hypothetical protein